mgnify:CR=1 FL=1
MKKFGNEFVVGLFVLACLVGLGYLTFSTGKVDLKKEGYHIYAVFNEVAGLNTKAPVKAVLGLTILLQDLRRALPIVTITFRSLRKVKVSFLTR